MQQYQTVLDAEANAADKLEKLNKANDELAAAKAELDMAQTELAKANDEVARTKDLLERAQKLSYKGADTEEITDADFEYLNEYVKAYRDAVEKQNKAQERFTKAMGDYEEASNKVAEGSELYAKHTAYTTALNAYNAFVKAEEEAKKDPVVTPSDKKNPSNGSTATPSGTAGTATVTPAEVDKAVTSGTIVASSKTAKTADPSNIAGLAYALIGSTALASYSILNVRRRRKENDGE